MAADLSTGLVWEPHPELVEINLCLLGVGTVGSQLLAQVAAQRAVLAQEHGVWLRLVGIADSSRALFAEHGLDAARGKALLTEAPTCHATALLESLGALANPVLLDCTAADGMESLYEAAFARGIHVVAANKKPLTLPLSVRRRVMGAARQAGCSYLYETTVGASLPVIGPLKDLIRTGDRVRSIQGAFSGTLGYLCNALMENVPLSRAVATARELGYTEPHPRDDLSGLDVARKALILARELGLPVELEDVEVEPFVPAELLAHARVPDFLRALETHDAQLTEQIRGYQREGKALRYLARIELQGEHVTRLSVGPLAVPENHPAARLHGSEAFIAFHTERYAEYPLIVQGPGAGGAVTAAGVLAEVLRLGSRERGLGQPLSA